MQSWGGGEEFLIKLAANVKGNNIIVASPEGEPMKIFQQNGIKAIRIDSLKKFYRKENTWEILSWIKILFNLLISTIRLIKVILTHKIDLILANGNFAGLYSVPLKILTRKKLVVIQHLIYKEGSLETKILKMLSRYADRLVSISDSVSDNLQLICGEGCTNKTVKIYHGINLPKLDEGSSIKNVNINIGIVGSIIRLKAIDKVIQAAKETIFINRDVHLHIFGLPREDEPDSIQYEKELMKFISEENLERNVHFHGFEKSKEKIYRSIDILINYSKIPESFSFTVLEALSFGKIVIASDVGGPKELIKNNVNGFLVPPSDTLALSEKIKYCIEEFNSIEIETVRNNARKSVEEKFSLERFTSEYKKLFDSILSV